MTTSTRLDSEVLVELARIIEGQEDADMLRHISRVAARLMGARQAATRLADAAGAYVADGAHGGARVAHMESLATDGVALPEGSLGAPLTDGDGRTIGRVVVSDAAADAFSPESEALLAGLARAVSAALVRRRLLASLEEAQRQRQAFFGVLSHELRTPITTIYGGTRVLRRSDDRMSGEARRQLLDDVADEAERLYRLVEDLLVLSRAERDAVVVAAEPILLQHLVARVTGSEQQRWPRADMRVATSPGLPPVMGDSTLVEQVMRNLLSNAVKYGGSDGHIEVSATPADDWVEVRVVDHGPGLDPGTQERVFELFYRAPDAPTRAQGAGIGLYVCRTLIEAMGGDIWVRSIAPTAEHQGGGTEFGFRLRAYDPDAGDPPEGDPAPGVPADVVDAGSGRA
jgi:signal transduction histidine kinase